MDEREQQLWDTIEAVAAENPDFVYDPGVNEYGEKYDCSYFPTAVQSSPCIIGVALRRVGSPPTPSDEGASALTVLRHHGFEDGVLRHFADIVQSNQDEGTPWGSAVAQAKEKVAKLPPRLLA